MDFFKKQASSFLSSQEEPTPKQDTKKPEPGKGEETPGYSELFGSANVLLDAAKSQFGGSKEGTKAPLDSAKLADAAEDVLQAASHYGKLEGTQYEGYVKKAEDYLQSYKSREATDLAPPAEELKKSAEEVKSSAPTEAPKPTSEAPEPEAPAPPKEAEPLKTTEE